jgi:putative N6-adenine-specific DNA methylase
VFLFPFLFSLFASVLLAMLPISAYAVATPGLEAIVAEELTGLGFVAGKVEPGGVPFECAAAGLYRANLQLRTASRVLIRISQFKATGFNDLEKHARRIDWPSLIAPDREVAFRVTSRKSRLYHGRAIEERLQELLSTRVPGVQFEKAQSGERREERGTANSGQRTAKRKNGERERGDDRNAEPGTRNDETELKENPEAQLIVVRLFRDQCTISLDSSGELLHRRGYRQAVARAPIRENLAAAILIASGWDGASELLDPMCGSGTIPIEAALMARRIPPGWQRRFGFERWPGFDRPVWEAVRDDAAKAILPRCPGPITGTDRDPGAVEASMANAERAGVAADITFRRATISAIEPRTSTGWLVTNPPYGVRVGERETLRNLFAQLGNVIRDRLPGWHISMLSTHRDLEAQVGVAFEDRLEFSNGGIRVRLVAAPVSGEK